MLFRGGSVVDDGNVDACNAKGKKLAGGVVCGNETHGSDGRMADHCGIDDNGNSARSTRGCLVAEGGGEAVAAVEWVVWTDPGLGDACNVDVVAQHVVDEKVVLAGETRNVPDNDAQVAAEWRRRCGGNGSEEPLALVQPLCDGSAGSGSAESAHLKAGCWQWDACERSDECCRRAGARAFAQTSLASRRLAWSGTFSVLDALVPSWWLKCLCQLEDHGEEIHGPAESRTVSESLLGALVCFAKLPKIVGSGFCATVCGIEWIGVGKMDNGRESIGDALDEPVLAVGVGEDVEYAAVQDGNVPDPKA